MYDFVLLGGFDVGNYVLLWFWWGDCVSFGVIEVFGFDILMIGFVCVMFVVMIFWFWRCERFVDKRDICMWFDKE